MFVGPRIRLQYGTIGTPIQMGNKTAVSFAGSHQFPIRYRIDIHKVIVRTYGQPFPIGREFDLVDGFLSVSLGGYFVERAGIVDGEGPIRHSNCYLLSIGRIGYGTGRLFENCYCHHFVDGCIPNARVKGKRKGLANGIRGE